MKRNNLLDAIRGVAIINMVLFHFLYSATYIFNLNMGFDIDKATLWQRFISMTFIIVSGVCSDLTKDKNLVKNGIKLVIIGEIITLITYTFIRKETIRFGILSLLGTSMIIMYLIRDRIKYNKTLLIIILLIYFITFNIPNGYIKIIKPLYLSKNIYEYNIYMLGLPSKTFYSSDYFPLIPHFFLYLFGNLLSRLFKKHDLYRINIKNNFLSKIGKRSLLIYLLHQVVILILLNIYTTLT